MRHHVTERKWCPLGSDRGRAVVLAVAKAVGSLVLTFGSLVVGPVFSTRWNVAMRVGAILMQLAASIWRASRWRIRTLMNNADRSVS